MYSGFPRKLLATIQCPRDGGPLHLPSDSDLQTIVQGAVKCAVCDFSYEISDGVLRLLPGQRPLGETMRDEQRARDRGAERYEAHFERWENAEELDAILAACGPLNGQRALDLACGTGRVTRSLTAGGASVVGVDLSEQSLRVLANRLPATADAGLVLANATQFHFSAESFDVVLSTQLLEHIPSSKQRASLLREAHSALRPSGTLLVTAYYYSLLRRLLRRPPEGFHAGGIFYHRFTVPELRAELGDLFDVADLYPLQPDRRALALLPRVTAWRNSPSLDRMLRRCAGQLLFLRARKRSRTDERQVGEHGCTATAPAPDVEPEHALPAHLERDF